MDTGLPIEKCVQSQELEVSMESGAKQVLTVPSITLYFDVRYWKLAVRARDEPRADAAVVWRILTCSSSQPQPAMTFPRQGYGPRVRGVPLRRLTKKST